MRKLIFCSHDRRIGVCTIKGCDASPSYVLVDFYDCTMAFNFSARLRGPEEILALYNALGEALDAVCPGLVSPLPDGEENPDAETIKKKASGLVYA